jgi:hypothetical protein
MRSISRQHLGDHLAFHVREAALDAVVLEGEALEVEAEEVEDGGVEVVERMDVLHGFLAEFIGLAVLTPGFTPAPVIQQVKPSGL